MINIIIPCYHSRETLPNTLRSLEWQTKRMFTTTLVIDCDGEDYSDIVSQFHFHIDIITLDKNVGPGIARQVGLDRTNCSHVLFLDSDDILQPRAIEVLSRECRCTDADILISQIIHEEKYGKSSIMPKEKITWLHGKVYSVKYLREYNIHFHPDLRINEDVYFNSLAFYHTEKKYFIEEPLVVWCDNKKSITRVKLKNGVYNYSQNHAYTFIDATILTKLEQLKTTDELTEELISEIAKGIIGIYNTYAVIKEMNFADNANWELFRQLINNDKVKKAIHHDLFYMYVDEQVINDAYVQGKHYLLHTTLIDFLNQYLEVPYEDYHC